MRIRVWYIPFLVALPLVFSCSKELSNENNSHISGTGTFTAVIDGIPWAAADSGRAASILGGTINLSGLSADNKQLTITLNDTVAGIYKLTQSSFSLATYSDGSSSGVFTTNGGIDSSQAGGIVTVTDIDKVYKTLSGTFSFVVFRNADGVQKQIRQGVFTNIPYINTLPPASGSDTMRASIDGGNWTASSIASSGISGQLSIDGSQLNGSQPVILFFPQNTPPGSYTLDYTGLIYYGLYSPITNITLVSKTGLLKILENNVVTRRIRGNFDFQATDTTGIAGLNDQLTNGYFSVRY